MFRRMGTWGRALLATTVVASAVGYATAQEGETSVDVITVQPMAEPNPADNMTPKQQTEAAETAVESASASCGAQSSALQGAKRERDIIRATCLDDKLSQCNANLQNMKRRQTSLNEAIAAGDSGRANHEFTVIGVLSQKFKMLGQAANQCVGQDLFETGDTQVKEEVDLFAPTENPAVTRPAPTWPVPFIPPPVSGVT